MRGTTRPYPAEKVMIQSLIVRGVPDANARRFSRQELEDLWDVKNTMSFMNVNSRKFWQRWDADRRPDPRPRFADRPYVIKWKSQIEHMRVAIPASPPKPQRYVGVAPLGGTRTNKIFDETVFRTEKSEWRMKGSSPEILAALMREIDASTADIELPSEDELEALGREFDRQQDLDHDIWINDHSTCTHSTSRHARRRCRQKREGKK